MNRLEINNLNKRYGNKYANRGINLSLENGVYGLLGPNGAGKTTLMKQLTTIATPTEGEILFNGKNIGSMGNDYRKVIGYLPQELGYYKNFTAYEFLKYMGVLKGLDKKELNGKVDEMLNLVGLWDVRKQRVGSFSGGMKRRVGIAQALLNDPKVLVLDEPTAGLDPQERSRFRNLISKISKDKIVILSTHIISDIESIAKETIMIKKGEIFKCGTHRDILGEMEGKIYVFDVKSEEEVEKISEVYKVLNIQRGAEATSLRVISEKRPPFENSRAVDAKFEDVYMFYFDMEDGGR